MSARYRVAIIGTGRMGGLIEDELPKGEWSLPYGHVSAYRAIPETEVVAVANRGSERLRRFSERFGVAHTYLDYRRMVLEEKPDIVSVTTPALQRAEPLIFCAEHGVRGVYAEKGLSASLEEADRIRDAIKRNGVAFNWGAMRRHHDGYRRLREAIARGDIGQPRHATMYFFTDLIKHHAHTIDLVSMLLGDPALAWVEGRLVGPDDPLLAGSDRPVPAFDAGGNRFVPPAGRELGDPLVGFFRVGFAGGLEASFVPAGRFEVDVVGTEGRAYAWENGNDFRVRRVSTSGREATETIIRPAGESPTVCTIRDLIRALETGAPTRGNIDVTMQTVEVQFGVACSHLRGGQRVALPIEDRSLYIPGG